MSKNIVAHSPPPPPLKAVKDDTNNSAFMETLESHSQQINSINEKLESNSVDTRMMLKIMNAIQEEKREKREKKELKKALKESAKHSQTKLVQSSSLSVPSLQDQKSVKKQEKNDREKAWKKQNNKLKFGSPALGSSTSSAPLQISGTNNGTTPLVTPDGSVHLEEQQKAAAGGPGDPEDSSDSSDDLDTDSSADSSTGSSDSRSDTDTSDADSSSEEEEPDVISSLYKSSKKKPRSSKSRHSAGNLKKAEKQELVMKQTKDFTLTLASLEFVLLTVTFVLAYKRHKKRFGKIRLVDNLEPAVTADLNTYFPDQFIKILYSRGSRNAELLEIMRMTAQPKTKVMFAVKMNAIKCGKPQSNKRGMASFKSICTVIFTYLQEWIDVFVYLAKRNVSNIPKLEGFGGLINRTLHQNMIGDFGKIIHAMFPTDFHYPSPPTIAGMRAYIAKFRLLLSKCAVNAAECEPIEAGIVQLHFDSAPPPVVMQRDRRQLYNTDNERNTLHFLDAQIESMSHINGEKERRGCHTPILYGKVCQNPNCPYSHDYEDMEHTRKMIVSVVDRPLSRELARAPAGARHHHAQLSLLEAPEYVRSDQPGSRPDVLDYYPGSATNRYDTRREHLNEKERSEGVRLIDDFIDGLFDAKHEMNHPSGRVGPGERIK